MSVRALVDQTLDGMRHEYPANQSGLAGPDCGRIVENRNTQSTRDHQAEAEDHFQYVEALADEHYGPMKWGL